MDLRCPWCGAGVPAGALACLACGRELNGEIPPTPAIDAINLRRLEARTALATAGIIVASAFAVFLGYARSVEASLLAKTAVDRRALAVSDERTATLGALYSFALVISIILWLMWQYSAHSNIRSMPGARTAPLLAVGGWFIPFANLVLPYRFMSELWLVSNGWQPKDPRAPKPWRVAAWWTAYLMGGIATNLSLGRIASSKTPEALRSAALLNVFALGAIAVAGLLAVRLIREVLAGQRRLHKPEIPDPAG